MQTQSQQSGDKCKGDSYYSSAIKNILTMIFRKEIVKPVDRFSSSSSEANHIAQLLKNYFKLTTITDDAEKLSICLDSLDDNIRKEFSMEENFSENKHDFDWVEATFLDKFVSNKGKTEKLFNIFKIKQRPNESIDSFVSALKVYAYDEIGDLSSDEKETHLSQAFLEGLHDKQLKYAVTHQNPDNLKAAIAFAKSVKSKNSESANLSEELNFIKKDNNNVNISALIERLKKLEHEVQLLKSQNNTNRYMRPISRTQVPWNQGNVTPKFWTFRKRLSKNTMLSMWSIRSYLEKLWTTIQNS